MLLFLLVGGALAWMHLAVGRMERRGAPALAALPELPEFAGVAPHKAAASPKASRAGVTAAAG